MKTTRRTTYGSPDYGCPSRNMTEALHVSKGTRIYGYHNDEIIYGIATGERCGDAHYGDELQTEILTDAGDKIWIDDDAFANVPKSIEEAIECEENA